LDGRLFPAILPAMKRQASDQISDQGSLLLIGGHESHGNGAEILDRFVQLAGGADADIVVITAASEEPDNLWGGYKTALRRRGVRHSQALHLRHRREAAYATPVQAIDAASGIFISGGDQGRLLNCLHDTPLSDALKRALARGACVAGTSAGASALAQHMLEQGDDCIEPRKAAVRLREGLCLLPGVVIDQHFSERQRLAPLLSAIAEHPQLYGIGIDENTALQVSARDGMEVIGAGGVTVIDAADMATDAHGTADGGRLEVISARLHVLPSGMHYRADDGGREAIARLLHVMKGEPDHEDRPGT